MKKNNDLYYRMLWAASPVLFLPIIPIFFTVLASGTFTRPQPLITLCEVGAGVTVQLVGWRGEPALTAL